MTKTIGLLTLAAILIAFIGCGMPGAPMVDDMYTRNVYPGANNTYSIGSPELLYSDGYFTNIAIGSIRLGGVPLLIPAYGELYITTPIITEMPTAGLYYLIQGATTSEELKGFTSNGAGRLTYTDVTEDRVAMVTASISSWLPAEDVPAIIAYRIFINDVGDIASSVADVISVGDSLDAMQMVSLVTLDPGDYIEIKVVSNIPNASLNVITMSLSITTVD